MIKHLWALVIIVAMFLMAMNVKAEISLPSGGADNAVLVKDKGPSPENDFHYKFLEPNKSSLIGSTDSGTTTDYPVESFSKTGHTHEYKAITNIADYKAVRSKLADKATNADNAEKADFAVTAGGTDWAAKADEADSATVADNGLAANAPIHTVPIKTEKGWSYTTPDIPQKGFISQVLAKKSDKDYDVEWTNRTVLPELQKDCVVYINADGKLVMKPYAEMRGELSKPMWLSYIFFLIGSILCTISVVLCIWGIIVLMKKQNSGVEK